MFNGIIRKILEQLIQKEQLIATLLSFALGAGVSALGANKDLVLKKFCSGAVAEEASYNGKAEGVRRT